MLSLALLFAALLAQPAGLWGDSAAEQSEARRVASWVPEVVTSRHSEQWVRGLAERLAARARDAGVSAFALRLTLGSLPPSELPDDVAAAATFCFDVALKADAALRSGYSPTQLASELRQVRRAAESALPGPGLAGRGKRPLVHGIWNTPSPAGGGPSNESGRSAPSGGGRGDSP